MEPRSLCPQNKVEAELNSYILFGSRWLPASPSDKDNTADSFPGDSMEDVY